MGSPYELDYDGLIDVKTSNKCRPTATATAGGNTIPLISVGVANLGLYWGSGLPTISAAQGSLYLRTDGSSVSTRLYVNTNGSTGWTNVTTAT